MTGLRPQNCEVAVFYPTILTFCIRFPTKREVEVANGRRLDQLPGQKCPYGATDTPGYDSKGHPVSVEQMDRLLGHLVAQKSIFLKVRACGSNKVFPF
jgi:hypothetical protein